MSRESKIALADSLVCIFAALSFVLIMCMMIEDNLWYGLCADLAALGCAISGHWRPK